MRWAEAFLPSCSFGRVADAADNEPGPHDPDVVVSLKELAGKGSGKHRIVCESDGVATEYWLEGGEVRSREVPSAGQAAPSMAAFEAAALSEFAALVPKLESELDGKEVADLDGIEIAIRDVTHSSSAASIVAHAVVSDSFEEASRKLRNLAGVKVPATTLSRDEPALLPSRLPARPGKTRAILLAIVQPGGSLPAATQGTCPHPVLGAALMTGQLARRLRRTCGRLPTA